MLSFEKFQYEAKRLAEISVSSPLQWNWKELSDYPGNYNCYLETTVPIHNISNIDIEISNEEKELDSDLIEIDPATILKQSATEFWGEYHIVYNQTFSVPTLYFNFYHSSSVCKYSF